MVTPNALILDGLGEVVVDEVLVISSSVTSYGVREKEKYS